MSEGANDIPQARSNKRWYQLGFLALLILLIVYIVFGNGAELIARPYIEGKLRQFGDNLTAQAAASGDIANFTYDDITIEGGLFNKKATIINPKLEYTAKLPFSNIQRTDLYTSKAVITAAQLSNNTIHVDFPEAFHVERSGYTPIKITFDQAPRYIFKQEATADQHTIQLPTSVTLLPETKGITPVHIAVTYKNPIIERSIIYANTVNKTHISFDDVAIQSSAEDKVMRIGHIEGTSEEGTSAKDQRKFNTQFNLQNLTVKEKDTLFGPYQFDLDVAGEYILPDASVNLEAEVNDMQIDFKKLALQTQNYNVNFSGHIEQKPDDPMLFGEGNLVIHGLDKFRNSEFMPAVDAEIKDLVITTVTGNPDENATDADINIMREKQGAFYIGQTTFENLVGMIVTHALMKQKEAGKALPGPDASKAKNSAPLPPIGDSPSPTTQPTTPAGK